MSVKYEAWGRVRGHCGHEHTTIKAALKCALADGRAVERTYGRNSYSDRSVRRVDCSPLSDEECREAERAQYEIEGGY